MKESAALGAFAAPKLAKSFVIAGFQVLSWLFIRPTAWRAYLAIRQPSLAPDFTLGDLGHEVLSDREMRRMLLALSLCWCILALGTCLLASCLLGGSMQQILFGVFYGFILTLAVSALLASLLSVFGGVTGGLVIGVVFTLAAESVLLKAGSVAVLVSVLQNTSFIVALVGGIPALGRVSVGVGAVLSVGIGVTGALNARPSGTGKSSPLPTQLGGVVLGVVLCGGIDGLVLYALFLTEKLANFTALLGVCGLLVGLLVFCAAALHQHSLVRRAVLASSFSSLAFASILLASRAGNHAPMILVFAGVFTAFFYSSLFSLAFTAGLRVADPGAAAVASALGSGLPLILFLSSRSAGVPGWAPALICIAGIAVGLMVPRGVHLLVYPLEMAWNMILFRADQGRPRGTLLLRNAAFWDDDQRFPFLGLEDHILLAMKREPETARRALDWIGQSKQAWAAKAVRIEICAGVLERCATIQRIGSVHRSIPLLDDAAPGDPVRCFHDLSRRIDAALQFENAFHRQTLLHSVHAQINDLMLQGLPGRYRERLQPILSGWNRVVGDAIQAVDRLARERSEIENPYVVGVPLTPEQDVFVGRTEISAEIAQKLLAPQTPPLLLYGQRRMGKTSLLNNLGRILPERIVPLFVDLQGPASCATSSAGFLAAMSRAMIDSARRFRGLRLPPLDQEALEANPFGAFDQWLDAVEETLEDRVALLALDEFEALEQCFRKHRLDEASVLGLFRHIVQHRRCFRILLAASHSAEEFGPVAGYLINLQMLKMDYLGERDAWKLVERPLRGFALRYGPGAAQRTIDLTRGHPHLLQSLCYEIVCLKNEQERELRGTATVEDVELAAERTLKHGSMFFFDIAMNQLTPEARALAVSMARGEECSVARDEALAILLRRDVVEPWEAGYRFQVELTRRWFASSRVKQMSN